MRKLIINLFKRVPEKRLRTTPGITQLTSPAIWQDEEQEWAFPEKFAIFLNEENDELYGVVLYRPICVCGGGEDVFLPGGGSGEDVFVIGKRYADCVVAVVFSDRYTGYYSTHPCRMIVTIDKDSTVWKGGKKVGRIEVNECENMEDYEEVVKMFRSLHWRQRRIARCAGKICEKAHRSIHK